MLAEQSFDPWGRRRNPTDWTFTNVPAPSAFFARGYTGHEHMDEFGLINMNGRLYDPVLASFLSPDNGVQAPDLSLSYNRYSYCLNNPLKYTDPSGYEYTYLNNCYYDSDTGCWYDDEGNTIGDLKDYLLNNGYEEVESYLLQDDGSTLYNNYELNFSYTFDDKSGDVTVQKLIEQLRAGANVPDYGTIQLGMREGVPAVQDNGEGNFDYLGISPFVISNYKGINGLSVDYVLTKRTGKNENGSIYYLGGVEIDVEYTSPKVNNAKWAQYIHTNEPLTKNGHNTNGYWDDSGTNHGFYYYTDTKMKEHTNGNTVSFYDMPTREINKDLYWRADLILTTDKGTILHLQYGFDFVNGEVRTYPINSVPTWQLPY